MNSKLNGINPILD